MHFCTPALGRNFTSAESSRFWNHTQGALLFAPWSWEIYNVENIRCLTILRLKYISNASRKRNLPLVFGHTQFPGGSLWFSFTRSCCCCILIKTKVSCNFGHFIVTHFCKPILYCVPWKKLFLVPTFSGPSNFALVVVFFVLITCDRFVQRPGWLQLAANSAGTHL